MYRLIIIVTDVRSCYTTKNNTDEDMPQFAVQKFNFTKKSLIIRIH